MSVPTTGLRMRSRPSAFIGLVALVVGALAAAMMLTLYLLHTTVIATGRPVTPVGPEPYKLLFLTDSAITVSGPDHTTEVTLPAAFNHLVRRVIPAPDGSHLLVITGSSSRQEAWLWDAPADAPRPIQIPHSGTGVQMQYLATVWVDSRTVQMLVAQNSAVTSVRLSIASPQNSIIKALHVQISADQLLSLSPNGRQVALAEMRPGTGTFATQQIVRLQHLFTTRSSVAYQYLGTTPPAAVLWSSDDGTVAIVQQDHGLALQKSSGRGVLVAAQGRLPAVFSAGNANFAFISGTGPGWRIQVVSLHNEVARVVSPPLSQLPQTMYWTPDDRVLVYITTTGIWQLDPTTGIVTRRGDRQPGLAQGITSASAQFVW